MLGLPYVHLVFLTYILLRGFTAMTIRDMNIGTWCPTPPFPFPTYHP
jgi:hypothetical protein